MTTLQAIVERNEDGFYAYVDQLDGCAAGGSTYAEVKQNLEEIFKMFIQEDPRLTSIYAHVIKLQFEVSLDSVFDLLPEVNRSQLDTLGKLNPGLLSQYITGS